MNTQPKLEFAKKIVIVNYTIMIFLIAATFLIAVYSLITAFESQSYNTVDIGTVMSVLVTLDTGWIVLCTSSTAFYLWKAKNENKVKIPVLMISSLPKEMQEKIDVTQVIVATINMQ